METTINFPMNQPAPQVCPTCGRCPTCGHTHPQIYPTMPNYETAKFYINGQPVNDPPVNISGSPQFINGG